MSFGIIEVITLLLGMAGFGLTANPKPPTADQALQYAIADADVVAHLDAASLVPGNYKLLGQLVDQPQIKSSSELAAMVRKAVGEVEGARGVAKLTTGIDVTTDISDATAFVQFVPNAEPRFVIAVHGKFSAANLDKIAQLTGKPAAKLGGGLIVEGGVREPAIALTRDAVMLIGAPDLIRDRLADGWKPPSRDAGTNLGYFAEVIGGKPVFAVVLTMSPAARSEAVGHLGTPNFASDLVTRHKAAAFSIFHDGIGWTWVDTSKAGVDSMELMSDGVIDVLRAAQIAPRGIAKIAMGALDSYSGSSAQIDDLIKHKADIQKIIETYSGDGNFKVKLDKNPKAMRLTVRATGKTVSEVLPLGMVLPAGIAGYLAVQAKAAAPAAPMMIEQPASTGKSPPPAGKQPAPAGKQAAPAGKQPPPAATPPPTAKPVAVPPAKKP
jgi:hypothetical protein